MTTTEAEAKELIREFTEELNAGNYDALDGFFVEDYSERYDNRTVGELVQEERDRGEAFVDKHEDLDGILTDTDERDGQHLNAWYTVTGTHEREFLHLPPTGHQVEHPFIRTFVIEDGHITRYRMVFTLGFLLDLGLDWETLTEEVDMQQYLISPKEVRD